MLIGSRSEKGVLALQALEPALGIGQQDGVQVAQVRGRVHVEDWTRQDKQENFEGLAHSFWSIDQNGFLWRFLEQAWQSTVNALPYANYKIEWLDSLLSIPTHRHVGSCK